MGNRFEVNIKVGLFVSLGVSLIMLAIILLGGADSIFVRRNRYVAYFPNIDGLMIGSKVSLNGIRIGAVDAVEFDSERSSIKIEMALDRNYARLIRKDSYAEIVTQGVLGDKFISINSGSKDQPELAVGTEIPNAASRAGDAIGTGTEGLMASLSKVAKGLDQLIQTLQRDHRAEKLFDGLAETAKNFATLTGKLNTEFDQIKLKKAIEQLYEILQKVNNGTGTVGALINDPALYDDVKSLIGGANRNRIVRNLVRETIRDKEAADQSNKKQ